MLKMLGIRSSTWDICSILPKKNYSTWKIKVSVVSILQTTFHTTYSGQALFRDGHRCVLTRKFNSSDRKSNHHFGPASCSRGLSYYARVRHVNGSLETEWQGMLPSFDISHFFNKLCTWLLLWLIPCLGVGHFRVVRPVPSRWNGREIQGLDNVVTMHNKDDTFNNTVRRQVDPRSGKVRLEKKSIVWLGNTKSIYNQRHKGPLCFRHYESRHAPRISAAVWKVLLSACRMWCGLSIWSCRVYRPDSLRNGDYTGLWWNVCRCAAYRVNWRPHGRSSKFTCAVNTLCTMSDNDRARPVISHVDKVRHISDLCMQC